MNIDWSIIPTYELNVGDIDKPKDIIAFMRKHRINKYVYEISYANVMVIKYGMSYEHTGDWGDRIYTQVGRSKSWGDDMLRRGSGATFTDIEDDFEAIFGVKPDRKKFKIKVWDMTKYPYKTIKPVSEVKLAESSLISAYYETTGHYPIGNLNKETSAQRNAVAPIKEVFDVIFEYDNSTPEQVRKK